VIIGTNTHTLSALDVFGSTPETQGQGSSLDLSSGTMALGLSFTDKSSAIAVAKPGADGFTLASIAMTGDTNVPGVINAKWLSFNAPTVNSNGTVAFGATLSGVTTKLAATNNSGIWLDNGSTNTLMARTGSHAPGINRAFFATLQTPVLNNSGQLAFLGTLALGGSVAKTNAAGLWSTTVSTNGALGLVVRTGDAAPGISNATFASFQQIVLPDSGGPLFTATLAGVKAAANSSLWSVDQLGTLHLVMQTGNTIAVHGVSKTIKSFSVFKALAQVSGQSRSFEPESRNLAILATFTDGTWAVVQTQAP
jgi:hypothetical protein